MIDISDDNLLIYNDWKKVIRFLIDHKDVDNKIALVLSSVIHEVCNYSSVDEIKKFWLTVFSGSFDYIVIRDMMPGRSIDRPSDITDLSRVYRKFWNSSQLEEFQNNFGSIENNKQLIHFLLKYQYLEPNWAREVKENYFALYREQMLSFIPLGYKVIYHEHFIPPYIKEEIENDLAITIKDPTHLKLIIEKI